MSAYGAEPDLAVPGQALADNDYDVEVDGATLVTPGRTTYWVNGLTPAYTACDWSNVPRARGPRVPSAASLPPFRCAGSRYANLEARTAICAVCGAPKIRRRFMDVDDRFRPLLPLTARVGFCKCLIGIRDKGDSHVIPVP
jgi:hypothetical protein